jgi:hypothetical protein
MLSVFQNWGYSAKRGDGGNDFPHAYLFLSKAKYRQPQCGDLAQGARIWKSLRRRRRSSLCVASVVP